MPDKIVPVIIDTRLLRPLPKALFKSACSNCDKLQAMWEMGPPDAEAEDRAIVCGLCFLYETEWGKKRNDEIVALAEAVGKEVKGDGFLVDIRGHLLGCADADRLVASIALTSRMFQMQDKAGVK